MSVLLMGVGGSGQTSSPNPDPAFFLVEPDGAEVYDEDGSSRFVWDCSYHEVGGTHYLIYSRWPEAATFNTGWYTDSEICYATASSIAGPYTFGGILLQGTGGADWDSDAVHNVKVYNFGGTYYMYFMGSTGTADSQQIGVATASSITGPYTRDASNPIIPNGGPSWELNRVSNPSVVNDSGTYRMLYKGYNTGTGVAQLGLATASNPAGPWTKYASNPVIAGPFVEDPDMWIEGGGLKCTFKDVAGTSVGSGDSLWMHSANGGITWTEPANGYHAFRIDDWVSLASRAERACVVLNSNGSKKGIFVAYLTAAGTKSSIRYAAFLPGPPIVATAGTYIQAGNPTFNWGATTTSIWVGHSTSTHRGLIRADLSTIPANATILRAWAIVHWQSTSGTSATTIEFRPLTQAWVEGTGNGSASGDGATWNTYDGVSNWPGGAGALADSSSSLGSVSLPNGETFGRIIVPLTGATLANLANGLLMRSTTDLTNARAFSSDEHATTGRRPKLLIEWAV